MLASNILKRRSVRAFVGAFVVAGLGATALVAATGNASAAGGSNLIPNSGFEGATGTGDLTAWAATTGGTLSLVNGAAAAGSWSAKITQTAAGASQYAIYGVNKASKAIPKGQVFRANAQLKVPAATGKQICLQLLEQTSTATVQTASGCLTPTAAQAGTWLAFPTVSITTTTAGSSLKYQVRQASGSPGNSFQVDAFNIVNADVTAPGPVTLPKATVNSATKVTLSWTAATGAYAYRIYRNHKTSATAVVIGATSWADTGVTPGNNYSYQIQAVDFAGNASALTANILALTPWTASPLSISYWKMDEASGTTVLDAQGSNPGVSQNVTKNQPGWNLTSYLFNGTSSQVIIPDSATLNPGSSRVKFAVRMKTTSLPAVGVDYDLFRKGAVPGNEYKMELQPNGQASCTFDGSLDHFTIFAGPKLNDNVWHTVMCTKENTSITLTVDGVSWSRTVSIGDISNARDLIIGAYPDFDFYKGYLDNAYFRLDNN